MYLLLLFFHTIFNTRMVDSFYFFLFLLKRKKQSIYSYTIDITQTNLVAIKNHSFNVELDISLRIWNSLIFTKIDFQY